MHRQREHGTGSISTRSSSGNSRHIMMIWMCTYIVHVLLGECECVCVGMYFNWIKSWAFHLMGSFTNSNVLSSRKNDYRSVNFPICLNEMWWTIKLKVKFILLKFYLFCAYICAIIDGITPTGSFTNMHSTQKQRESKHTFYGAVFVFVFELF